MTLSLSLSLSLSLASPVEPDTSGDDLDVVRHPLLTPSAREAAEAHPEMDAEELWQHLWTYDEVLEIDGQTTEASGVVWHDDVVSTEFIHGAPAERGRGPLTTSENVLAWLDGGGPDTVELTVLTDRAAWDPIVTVPHAQGVAMLRGEVTTASDLKALRVEAIATRRAAGELALQPIVDHIARAGGTIESHVSLAGSLEARLPSTALQDLVALPEVARVEERPNASLRPEGAGHSTTITAPSADGVEFLDWYQANPLHNAGYRGRSFEIVVLGEGGADEIHNVHDSFRTGAGTGRVLNCDGTSHTTCTYVDVTSGNGHATDGVSVVASDLTAGQDPAITDPVEQEQRSGFMRDGFVMGIDSSPMDRMVDLVTSNPSVHILFRSEGVFDSTDDCSGAEPADQNANAIYEAGVAYFKSAGNDNSGQPVDSCTVSRPGAAIGVFTTAAMQLNISGVGQPDYDSLHLPSGRGGTATQGYGRTIVDMAGISGLWLRAAEDAATVPQYNESMPHFAATSAANPGVAGAAALFRDWYVTKRGNAIDDPGLLYANLLLMGDGLVDVDKPFGLPVVETYDLEGFHNRFGAGRLRMRVYGNGGLDNPGGYKTGSGCLGQLSSHVVSINNGNPLPTGVDYVKAVTWWYDRDHDDYPGAGSDQYLLELERWNASTGVWDPVVADSSTDNKQRVFSLAQGGEIYQLRVTAVLVDSMNEGCGANANRIYYALLFEDNARDDGNDLDIYVRPHPEVP